MIGNVSDLSETQTHFLSPKIDLEIYFPWIVVLSEEILKNKNLNEINYLETKWEFLMNTK